MRFTSFVFIFVCAFYCCCCCCCCFCLATFCTCFSRYFGAARDLPGVRELFEQARKLLYSQLSFGDLVVCRYLSLSLPLSLPPSLSLPLSPSLSLPPSLSPSRSLPLSPSLSLTHTAAKLARKTRGELAKLVDADYYGYRDEDDGTIVPLEQEREREGQHCWSANV